MTLADKAPNFFIIGAAKAGTTSLYDALRRHPQVFLSVEKEPAFFCDDEYFRRGNDWYLRTFFREARGEPSRGEATSRYLFFGEKVAPKDSGILGTDIAENFIVIFRDPVRPRSFLLLEQRTRRRRGPSSSRRAAPRAREAGAMG